MGFPQAGFTPQTNSAQTRAISAGRAVSSRAIHQNDVAFHRHIRCTGFTAMDKDPSMDVLVRRTEIGRGKRVAIVVAIALVSVALIGVVAAGFHGRHIPQDAAAITTPVPANAKTGWRPWWLQ